MFLNATNQRSKKQRSITTNIGFLFSSKNLLLFLWLLFICVILVGSSGSGSVNTNDINIDDGDDDVDTISTATLSQLLPLAKTTTTETPIIPEAPIIPQPPEFKFKHRIYNVSIPENSVGKTYVVQPPGDDTMGIWHENILNPSELDIKYRIIYGDKEKQFKAEDRVIGDFTFLAIRTRTSNIVLNREKTDQYYLKIRATVTHRDAAKTKHQYEDECQVNVHVLDTNDLSPFFYPNEYAVSVPEDKPLHQSIVKVMAEDADLGSNGEIYYSFIEDNDWFSVHLTSGVITLTRPLRYVDKSVHDLIVIATDRGGITSNRLSQPSKAKVKVRVKQVCISFHIFIYFFV